MKYKTGNKVQIKAESVNAIFDPDKKKWFGKEMIICQIATYPQLRRTYYRMKEARNIIWSESEIEGLASTVKPTDSITIDIDPLNPSAAHKQVKNAIAEYTKIKRKKKKEWTENEILEAKRVTRDLLCKLFEKGYIRFEFECGPNFSDDMSFRASRTINYGPSCATLVGTTHKTKNDIYNEWIGKCVCLCKTTGTPIPEFILNK